MSHLWSSGNSCVHDWLGCKLKSVTFCACRFCVRIVPTSRSASASRSGRFLFINLSYWSNTNNQQFRVFLSSHWYNAMTSHHKWCCRVSETLAFQGLRATQSVRPGKLASRSHDNGAVDFIPMPAGAPVRIPCRECRHDYHARIWIMSPIPKLCKNTNIFIH